jgi:hypothetical protein
VLQQTRIFEDTEMPRRRRPRMLEARRKLTCRRGATSKMQRQQDLSTCGMSDGIHHLVERG